MFQLPLPEYLILFQSWINVRYSAVLPLCLPGVLRLNNKIHKTVRNTMKDSIDTASSILVIILLILIAIFAGIFCAVEIYSETITVVQLGNDVMNWTYHHQPELMNMFPAGKTYLQIHSTFNCVNSCTPFRCYRISRQCNRKCVSVWSNRH